MKARILDDSEYGRLEGRDVSLLVPYVRASDLRIAVVESYDQIVANLAIVRMPMLEGVQIDPGHRNAGVTRALLNTAFGLARSWGYSWAFAGSADDKHSKRLERLGGEFIPMKAYAIPLGGK